MRAALLRVATAVGLLGLSACGDFGPSGGGATATPTATAASGTPTATFLPGIPTPTATRTPRQTPTPGGSPSVLPPIVMTGRVVFAASNGEQCCVAVDPILLPQNPQPGQATLVLDDLPVGPATVTVDGFTENFAPAPPGVTATCKTVNTTGVAPCDASRNASPAYTSDPVEITIFPGVRVNLGDVDVAALPFVLEFIPPQNATVPLPVEMAFTVVDAETGIAEPSVTLEITLDVPQGEPPVFRRLTKRVALALDACSDGSGEPCSADGDNALAGFKARGVSEYLAYLPPGPVEARITAQNLADPPRDLDFRYAFVVAPAPDATATPTVAPPARADADAVLVIPTPTPTETPLVP